jgi:hypothetical protein
MIDELRRTQNGGRSIHAGEHVAWQSELDNAPCRDTPDSFLAARQGIKILFEMPPAYQALVSAVLECDTKAEAAKRIGLDPSRATQMLTHQRLDDRRCVAERLKAAL